jgi:hypothetical protein
MSYNGNASPTYGVLALAALLPINLANIYRRALSIGSVQHEFRSVWRLK